MRGDEHYWTPERVASLREMAADHLNDTEIGEQFGVSRYAIEYARRLYKVETGYVRPGPKKPPADFAEIAPTLTKLDCAKHYQVSTTVIRRWYADAEIKAKRYVTPKGVRTNPRPAQRIWRQPGMTPMSLAPQRDWTIAGRAQLHLQHLFPVFKATVRDPSAPKDVWIVNGRRITESEMIQRAERHGFQAVAA